MNSKVIKGIGIGATVLGSLVTLVGNWADGKILDAKIAEEVAKALANQKGEA